MRDIGKSEEAATGRLREGLGRTRRRVGESIEKVAKKIKR